MLTSIFATIIQIKLFYKNANLSKLLCIQRPAPNVSVSYAPEDDFSEFISRQLVPAIIALLFRWHVCSVLLPVSPHGLAPALSSLLQTRDTGGQSAPRGGAGYVQILIISLNGFMGSPRSHNVRLFGPSLSRAVNLHFSRSESNPKIFNLNKFNIFGAIRELRKKSQSNQRVIRVIQSVVGGALNTASC